MLLEAVRPAEPRGGIDRGELRYRPHIDGLRAIAVLAVIFFHVGFGFARGGYVGVDVFFVISGFLIARIIYTGVAAGRFSFAEFYCRRAIRILPALLVVIAATGAASFLVQLPPEFLAFSKSALASLLFSANLWFLATTGYFMPASDQFPLLHLWSLGVEEQFYIAFPCIVMFIHQSGWRALQIAIAAILVSSLAACCYTLTVSPEAAFYATPFRAYELLVGASLAFPGIPAPRSGRVSRSAAIAGLALVVLSIVLFSKAMTFPGLSALVPCAGTALLIWGGEGPANAPTRLLGLPPMQWMGRLSYPLYLVHWPLLVFTHQLHPEMAHLRLAWTVVGLSLVCAIVLHAGVEWPARRLRALPRAMVLSGSAGIVAVMAGLAGFFVLMGGFPGRISPEINDVLAFENYDASTSFRSGSCFITDAAPFSALKLDECEPKTSGKQAVIWGDSGMAMYAAALQAALAARGYGMSQFTASACPPLLGRGVASRPNCAAFNDRVMGEIETIRPAVVILGALWPRGDKSLPALDRTVTRLRELGARVVILGPGPQYDSPVPKILARKLSLGDPDVSAPISQDSRASDDAMRNHWRGQSDVTYVSILAAACRDGKCPLEAHGKPVQFDTFHLTADGARMFLDRFIDQIVPTT